MSILTSNCRLGRAVLTMTIRSVRAVLTAPKRQTPQSQTPSGSRSRTNRGGRNLPRLPVNLPLPCQHLLEQRTRPRQNRMLSLQLTLKRHPQLLRARKDACHYQNLRRHLTTPKLEPWLRVSKVQPPCWPWRTCVLCLPKRLVRFARRRSLMEQQWIG